MTWLVEVRVPGAGGAWTTVAPVPAFRFRREINSIASASVNVLAPSSGLQALLVNGNELRVRETAAGREWWRGRIRDVTVNHTTQEWTISALDNVVLVQDRKWSRPRTFPAVPANVIMDELLFSSEGEPRNGQLIHWDGETLTDAGLMSDLSGSGHDGTITGASSTVGRWGLARQFSVAGDSISAADAADIHGPTPFTAIIIFKPAADWTGSYQGCVLASKFAGSTGWKLWARYAFGGYVLGLWTDNAYLEAAVTGFETTRFNWAALVAPAGAAPHIWFNGTDLGPQAYSGPTAHAGAFAIGGTPNSGPFGSVILDDVYYYNRVLSATEIGILAGKAILEGGLGTVDTFTSVGFRVEQDDRLSAIDAL